MKLGILQSPVWVFGSHDSFFSNFSSHQKQYTKRVKYSYYKTLIWAKAKVYTHKYIYTYIKVTP